MIIIRAIVSILIIILVRHGSIVNSKMYFKNDMKDLVRQEKGEWRAYRDGKLINTLPADAQPGMTDKKEQEQILKEGKK